MTFSPKRIALVMFALVAASTATAQQGDKPPPKQSDAEQARPTLTVTVVNPTYRTVGQSIQANGNIEAREIASVTSQVSGLSLNKVLVDVGDTIKKGQLLAEYDASSVKNDIAQANASLKQAKIAANQASANAKRAKRLHKTKAISAIELDNYLYQEKQARAQIDAAKAVLNNQNLRASYAKVTAKVGGLITDKQAVLGTVGNPGTPLFSVMVNNELEWQANVPSELLNNITPQSPVVVTLSEDSGAPDGHKKQQINGKVRKIDPTINSQTRLGKVYVSMDANPKLRRGLFVRGAFLLGEGKNLVIPITCIIRKDGYNYVFIADANNRVTRKKVSVGQLDGNDVTVTEGLTPSDRVVSSGVGFLNNGDLVNIVN